jgi:two-component system cell cycle response regulator
MTTIDRVLSCPTLPSLPAVAVEVLALTKEPGVSLAAISKVVQNDPGLAAKVLKTVNSSFYGLQQPCSRLDRAMSYLGLQAVKSLVLGFSLVDATRGLGADGMDLKRHWRRTIFAASAARHLAQATGAADADEVFACALFQDIGVLACVAALGSEYTATLATAPEDHDLLCRHEREVFPFDHTTVGAELARKWKLPDVLVESIRKHHVPDASGLTNPQMVRLTALAMYVAESLSTPGVPSVVSRLGEKASGWFSISPERLASLLRSTATSATELAKLFEQDVAIPNAGLIMAEAQEALFAGSIESQRETDRLKAESQTDALTGAGNRRRFDGSLADSYTKAREERSCLSVLFIDGDKFKSINDTLGHSAGDAVLKGIARRVTQAVGDHGLVCRYGGEEFAVILPGLDGVRAREVAESVRKSVADKPMDLAGVEGAPASIPVTISIGVATMESGSGSAFQNAEQLVALADQAVYAAKSSGRNCVRAASPAAAPTALTASLAPAKAASVPPSPAITAPAQAAAGPHSPTSQGRITDSPKTIEAATALRSADGLLRILIVDDDHLAAKLLSMIFQRIAKADVRVAFNGADAIQTIGGNNPFAPTLVIIDQGLPDMKGIDLIRTVRSIAPSVSRVALITATPTDTIRDSSRAAGADLFASKLEMSTDVARWVQLILGQISRAAA